MVKRIGRTRRKTRSIMLKNYRKRGKIPLSIYFQELNEGDKVALIANSSIHEGMYFRRFHGKVGTVVKKLGSCYQVSLKDGSKEKKFNVHPIHLKKL